MRGHVLVVDDELEQCNLLREELSERGFRVTTEASGRKAWQRISDGSYDAVLTDVHMEDIDGIQYCRRVTEQLPDVPVIVMTAFGNVDTAVGALRAGAYDFVQKPFDLDTLPLVLERAIQHALLKKEVKRLHNDRLPEQAFGGLMGESVPMKRLYNILRKVAPTHAAILITGETGTGKELVAQAIHDASHRPGPFIAFNCSAIPSELVESELFGHVQGAFTGAHQRRRGLFAQAHQGTLLLDEIAELPLDLQPKLLRVLQERVIRPVGSDRDEPIDVRVLAATHQDLSAAVAEGRFRKDLLFRLNVIEVESPPLRTRDNDVLQLAQHFIAAASKRYGRGVKGMTSQVARQLLSYPWPGNVRELQNVMERAVALTENDKIGPEDLPERLAQPHALMTLDSNAENLLTLEEAERHHIVQALKHAQNNKAHAARILDIDRKTLYRKLKRHGIPTTPDPM